jgi:hypothetical protein
MSPMQQDGSGPLGVVPHTYLSNNYVLKHELVNNNGRRQDICSKMRQSGRNITVCACSALVFLSLLGTFKI